MLYYLTCLEPPFRGENLITLGQNIVSKQPKAVPQCFSKQISDFILSFFVKRHEERPDIEDVLSRFPNFVRKLYKSKYGVSPERERDSPILRSNSFKNLPMMKPDQATTTASTGAAPSVNLPPKADTPLHQKPNQRRILGRSPSQKQPNFLGDVYQSRNSRYGSNHSRNDSFNQKTPVVRHPEAS